MSPRLSFLSRSAQWSIPISPSSPAATGHRLLAVLGHCCLLRRIRVITAPTGGFHPLGSILGLLEHIRWDFTVFSPSLNEKTNEAQEKKELLMLQHFSSRRTIIWQLLSTLMEAVGGGSWGQSVISFYLGSQFKLCCVAPSDWHAGPERGLSLLCEDWARLASCYPAGLD